MNITTEMLRVAMKYDNRILRYDTAMVTLQSLGLTEAQAERLLSRQDEGTLTEVWL